MRLGLTTKILLYLSLLAIITVSNFGILLSTENHIKEQHDWVLHTHQVIEESERLLGHMRDAETGQRGFLLTLDKSYLKPYDDGVNDANSVFKLLKTLTQDNVVQQTRLGHVYSLMEQKFSELEHTIQLAKQDKRAEAMTLVKSDKGKNIMDSLRIHIREITSDEKHLLTLRTQHYQAGKTNLKDLFALEAIVLVVLIIVAGVLLQRSLVRPLIRMRKSIENEIDVHEISTIMNTSNNEIGVLAEEFIKMYREIEEHTKEKDNLIQSALNEIKTLKGIIPICSYCKQIRDEEGAWDRMEAYLSKHSDAKFSHGICPKCESKTRLEAGLPKNGHNK